MTPRLVAVNVVHELFHGPTRDTAIDKRPVAGPVRVAVLGLVGDMQCDTRHHGGRDKALYVYSSEDLRWWSSELDRPLPSGSVGENLTSEGLDVNGASIGERWCIGDGREPCVVEVTMPRTPCSNLSAWLGIPTFHRRFGDTGRVGAYARVLSGGVIEAGDPIVVQHVPEHGVTVRDVRTLGAEQARRLLDCDVELAEPLQRLARRIVDRARESADDPLR